MFTALLYSTALLLAALLAAFVVLRLSLPKLPNKFTIAFFHPYWYVYNMRYDLAIADIILIFFL